MAVVNWAALLVLTFKEEQLDLAKRKVMVMLLMMIMMMTILT